MLGAKQQPRLRVDAAFDHGSFGGTTFERISSDVGITGYALGGHASYLLPCSRSRVAGFARATLGLAKISLTLSDDYSAADPMHDRAWTSTAHVGGGLDVFAIKERPRGRLVALGLRLEAGYTRYGAVELDAIPEHSGQDPDAITIPTAATPLGALDPSAWTFQLGLIGRF